jgi:predicted nucleotidyltransferase
VNESRKRCGLLNQERVDEWLGEFVRRMREQFGERLVFVGHHGSWARGEARPESDIDTLVVLETLGMEESEAYRDTIRELTADGPHVSGLLLSTEEVASWPPGMLVQFFHGCKVLHGSLTGIAESPSGGSLLEHAQRVAAYNLLNARHLALYPHNPAEKVRMTGYMFKECLFALEGFLLATTGRFHGRKRDLLGAVTEPEDRTLVEIVQGWRKGRADRQERPAWYFRQLEIWCSRMVVRAARELEVA